MVNVGVVAVADNSVADAETAGDGGKDPVAGQKNAIRG